MNRKISVGMTVTIVILAMTVTFSITMLMAMRLFDHTVTSVKEKESMYNMSAGSRLTEDRFAFLPQPARLSIMITVRIRLIHLFFICLPSFMNLW